MKREPMMVFSPACLSDSSWAYLCSHEVRLNYYDYQENNNVSIQNLPGLLGEGKLRGAGKQENQILKPVKREIIDRLSGIVDTEDSRFEKLKQENLKFWEQGVQSLCQSMNKGVDLFYQGQLRVYSSIMQSIVEHREEYIPQACEFDTSSIHDVKVANQPYTFQSFPVASGKIDPNTSDSTKFEQLREKLTQCDALSLWAEPIDILNNGPEFFDGLEDLLLTTANTFINKKDAYSEQELQSLRNLQSEAIICLFGTSVLSGNYDLIILALNTINEFEKIFKNDGFVEQVFKKCQPALKSFLQQMNSTKQNQEPIYHCMQGGNLSGVFGIANQFWQAGMTERNTSITTDGTYLYLYISIQQRSMMMKIGTGERGSTAGRVYHTIPTNDMCEVTWVYCKGKLYSRKTSDAFGTLNVHDPVSLAIEGQVKFLVGELFNNPKLAENFNKNYPLLSDGESLYIVTMQVVQKRKIVRDELRAEFDLLQAKKKLDSKKASNEKVQKSANLVEEAKKPEEPNKKPQRKKRVEQKEPTKKEDNAKPAPANNQTEVVEPKPYKELDSYRVCEFSVHQFDLTTGECASTHEAQIRSDNELLKDPLIFEMHQSFSGLFSPFDCQQALKFNNDDIEAAVQWIVDEKEKPTDKNHIQRKKSTIIHESLVTVYNSQIGSNNVEVQILPNSILHPSNITTGKWTLGNGNITFHNTAQDNEIFSVFSLKDEDFKQIKKEEVFKTHQVPAHLFEREDFAQHYYDGKEWKCYTFQKICELIVKIRSLVAPFATSEKDDKESTHQDATKEGTKQSFFSPEGFMTEIQLYQPILLYGTLVKHHNIVQRNTQIHQHSSYITYNYVNKKFYVMIFNSQVRNIAIIEDLVTLIPKLEQEPIDLELKTFKEFAFQTLKWLNYVNESRFQMPWRWRQWSQNLLRSIELIEQSRPEQQLPSKLTTNPLTGLPESSPIENELQKAQKLSESQEAKKQIIKKLKKRLTKVQQKELQIELEKLDLECLNEKEAKEYISRAEKQRNERKAWDEKQAKQNKKTNTNEQSQSEKKLSVMKQAEEEKIKLSQMFMKKAEGSKIFCDGCGAEQNAKNVFCDLCARNIKPQIAKAFNVSNPFQAVQNFVQSAPGFPALPIGQYTLPREHICIAREDKKIYTFCATGSVQSLSFLFEILKTAEDEPSVLRAILDSVTFADNLSAYENPQLLDEIYNYFVKRLESNILIESSQYIWRILMVGWNLFLRTQNQQLELLILAVSQSAKNKDQTWSELPQQGLLGQITRKTVNLTPIVLFCMRFLYYNQASFYPLEFLTMSKVNAFVVAAVSDQVLVPTAQQVAETKVIEENESDDFEDQDLTNKDSKRLTPIRSAYFKSYDSEKNFESFSKFDKSVTEMPLDVLVLKQISKAGLFSQNQGPDSQNFKSQAYFAMPIQSVFMMELVEQNFNNSTKQLSDIDTLISFYTNEPMPQAPQNASAKDIQKHKHDFLMKIREQNAKLQEKLFNAFASAIIQSLQDYEEASDDQFFWDDRVSAALMRSFSFLIIQAINMLDWQNPCLLELPIKSLKFVEDAISTIGKKTLSFTKLFKPHQAKWLTNIQQFSQRLINMLHLSLGSLSQTYVSVRVLPTLLNIFEQLKKVFNFNEGRPGNKQEQQNMLNIFCVTNTEGVDATYERIFETQHPYPRQEIRQVEVIKVPRAIGYLVEFDQRCNTQNGQNDYVQIKSAEYEQRINDQFVTKIRTNGRMNPGQNYFLLLGKQIEIEFRAAIPRQERRRPGESLTQQMTQQMIEQRWGFRILVRPIFQSPAFITDQSIKTESYLPIYNRIESDSQALIYNWFMFFNMLIYLTSAYTQDLTDGNLITQQSGGELSIGSGVLNEEELKIQRGQTSLDIEIDAITEKQLEAQVELITYDGENEINNLTNENKSLASINSILKSGVLNWHLLKGGLNLQFTRQCQNATFDIEKCLQEGLRLMNARNKYNKHQQLLLKQLSQIQKPLITKHLNKNIVQMIAQKQAILKRAKTKILDNISEDFSSNQESWATELRELISSSDKEGHTLDQVLTKIRKRCKDYEFAMKSQKTRANFKKHLHVWTQVERLMIAAMLYHSDSLGDIKKFLDLDYKNGTAFENQDDKEQAFLKEQFSMIGRQLNVVLSWMLKRLAGQNKFQDVIETTLSKAQEIIDEKAAQLLIRNNETKQMFEEDKLALEIRQKEKEKKILEEKEKLEREEKSKEEASKKNEAKVSGKTAPQVSISKNKAPQGKGKRLNRPKLSRPLPKPKQEKKQKQHLTENAAFDVKEQAKGMQDNDEEKKHPVEVEKEYTKEIEYLEISGKELNELKNKISSETFKIFTEENLKSEVDQNSNLGTLSLFFDIDLQLQDTHEMLRKIFSKVKQRIEKIIDFEDPDQPIPRTLKIEQLNLGSPEEQVARDIKNRILILFEINSSVNFQSEVTKIDNLNKMNTFWRNKRMATILEELEEDQQSQQQILTELSDCIDEDVQHLDSDSSEDLMPIETKRAYSVPSGSTLQLKQKLFNGIGAAGAQTQRVQSQRKQSMEYSDWIESYRKWRLWNKKGEDEAELLSPYGSPLQSVVSFAKFTAINDTNILRNIMLDQQYIAFFRLYGLQMQEKLFKLCADTPFGRFVWGNQSSTLQESTLHKVETCGERLTKQLNISSRALVQLLMGSFVASVQSFERKMREKLMISYAQVQQMKAQKRIQNKEEEKQTLLRQDTKAKQEEYALKKRRENLLEDAIVAEDLKKILHTLNDIRVLMNNIYTREHVLESLRQDCKLSTQDSLGIDKIQAFLKSVVSILISATRISSRMSSKSVPSITKLKQNISHVTRLVLNLFISQDKIMIRQTETQRILQEMLLDITVEQLEQKCYKSKNGVIQSKMHKKHYQEEQIQLLKILCEVIRISNDTQSAMQADSKEVNNADGEVQDLAVIPQHVSSERQPAYFLSAGSQKVMRCASLLAYMLHHVEAPSVMRLAIKCSTLFFKLVDLHKLKMIKAISHISLDLGSTNNFLQKTNLNDFIIETLKTIGSKISNIAHYQWTDSLKGKEILKIKEKPIEEVVGDDIEETDKEKKEIGQEFEKAEEEEVVYNEATQGIKKLVEIKEPSKEVQVDKTKKKEYFIFCSLNTPQEEDFIFIMTALFHWYSRYPNKNLKLINDPSEICQVPKPNLKKVASEKRKEDKAKQESDKDKLPDIVNNSDKSKKLPDIEKPKVGEDMKNFLEILPDEIAKQQVLVEEVHVKEDEAVFAKDAVLGQDVIDQPLGIIKEDEELKKVNKEKEQIEKVIKVEEQKSVEVKPDEAQNAEVKSEEIKHEEAKSNDAEKSVEPKFVEQEEQKYDGKVVKDVIAEEQKHENEIDKVADPVQAASIIVVDYPLASRDKVEAKIVFLNQNAEKFQSTDYYNEHLEEIIIIQKFFAKVLAKKTLISKIPAQPDPVLEEEKRVKKFIQMLEKLAEIRNTKELQEALTSQKKELLIIQQIKVKKNFQELSMSKIQDKEKLLTAKAEQLKQQKPLSSIGLRHKFDSLGGGMPPSAQIKIANLLTVIEVIAKETYKDPFTTDDEKEKIRCMEEKNYYIRMQAILKETISIAEQLFASNTVIMDGPFSLEKASELSDLLIQAYRGQLSPIGYNPHMTEENSKKEILVLPNNDMKISAKDLFPITPEKLESMSKKKTDAPMTPELIKVAPKNFVVTLCEKYAAIDFVKEAQNRINEVKSQQRSSKVSQNGGSVTLSKTSVLKQGASQLVIIQELIQLVRSMIQTTNNDNQSDDAAAKFQAELIAFFNLTVKQLATKDWDYEFTQDEKLIILGLFSVVGGWQPQIKTGQLIQVFINNVWSNATVIDDGVGKDKISVILDEDDSLQITKINKDKARPVNRFEIDLDGDFGVKIDQQSLIDAIIAVFEHSQNCEEVSVEREIEYAQNTATTFQNSILSSEYLLQMMLKTSSQLKWTFTKKEDAKFEQFIQIMINISGNEKISPTKNSETTNEVEEDKTMIHWERALIQAWERLIDKSEQKNLNMFAPREFVYPNASIKRQSTQSLRSYGIVRTKEEVKEIQNQLKKDTEFAHQVFTQSQNTLLSGLQKLTPKNDYALQNLKRLQYWEKNVVPELIKFCTGYYRPWEWKFYFAQLRTHLSLGQVDLAHADASQMFNGNVPSGCVIPDIDHDWSPKIIDECICDSWLIAKIASNSQGGKANIRQNSRGSPNTSNAARSNYALLDRLLHLEIDEILVHIKAVDSRSNSCLAEYFDSDSMTVSQLWLPINNLLELSKPLPARPIGISNKKLAEDFQYSIQKISSVYSRQTLNKLFQSFQNQQNNQNKSVENEKKYIVNLPTDHLKLQEVISWSVWETFSDEPIDGWLKQINPVMLIKKTLIEVKTQRKEEQIETSSHLKKPTLKQIVEQVLNKVALETLNDANQNPKNVKTNQNNAEIKSTEITLQLIKQLLADIAAHQSDQAQERLEDLKIFNDLVEWCVNNWYEMSGKFEKARACLELYEEFRKYKAQKPKDGSGIHSDALPLHALVPNKGANANATLILFKKRKVKLTTGSKVQFFSDAEKTDLLQEITTVGSQQDGMLDPLVIAKGKVWLDFQEGSNCLVPVDMRSDERSSVECSVFHIPKQWTVVCWLTEVISTALVTNGRNKAPKLVIDILSKLITAIQIFYDESRAPIYLKSIILKLISRLIIKLRCVYIEIENQHKNSEGLGEIQSSDHFKRLFITNDFIQTVLSELLIQMDTSACNALSNGNDEKLVPEGLSKVLEYQNKENVLHPSFVQDAIEFLMHFFIPTSRKLQLASYKDLLPNKSPDSIEKAFSMPLWIEPLLKVSNILHFFRKQTQISADLLKKMHQSTKLGSQNLDNIVVLLNLPANDPTYTKVWIKNRIFELIEKHKARVLDPTSDVVFIKNIQNPDLFDAVIIIDGFSHQRSIDDGQSEDNQEIAKKHKIKLLHIDSDEEETKQDDGAQKEAERLKRLDEEKPKYWACPACTVENQLNNRKCDCCEGPQPPLEEIKAAHMIKLNEERKNRGEVIEKPKDVEEEEPLYVKRLKMLQSDMRHMISHEQRIKLLESHEQKQKREKILSERAAQKAQLLAEEEAKHAKEQEKDKPIEKADESKEAEKPKPVDEEVKQEEVKIELKIDSNDDSKKDQIELILQSIKLAEENKIEAVPVQRLNSIASSKSGENWEDMDSGAEENKELDIDLENLPEDRYERFRILGVEPFALDEGDNDLADMMEMSAVEEIKKKQDAKKAEKEAKRKQAEEEKLQKEKEAAKKALQSANNPVALIKIETLWGQKTIFNHEKANVVAQEILRKRLQARKPCSEQDFDPQNANYQSEENNDEFKFSEEVVKIIDKIQNNFKTIPLEELELPQNEPLLEDFDITKSNLKQEKNLETILELFSALAHADVRLFYKVLESQGFDIQLSQAALPTFNISQVKNLNGVFGRISDLQLLSQVKRLIEFDYCNFSNQVVYLEPSEIRLLHQYKHVQVKNEAYFTFINKQRDEDADREAKSQELKDAESTSIIQAEEMKEDSLISSDQKIEASQTTVASQVTVQTEEQKAQIDADIEKIKKATEWHKIRLLRNCLKQMNYDSLVNLKKEEEKEEAANKKYTARVIPIGYFDDRVVKDRYVQACEDLNQQEIRYMWALLKTFNEYFVPAVPIINQAASFSEVPSNSIPMTIALYMKEIRDLSLNCVKTNLRFMILEKTSVDVEKVPTLLFDRLKMAEKQTVPNADQAPTQSNAGTISIEQQASSANNGQQQNNCIFLKAYEQLKDIDIALLRPKKPIGSEPHISFQILLAEEHVVGLLGPYKAFFSDISSEIQPSKLDTKLDENQLGLLYPCANQRDKEQYGADRFVLCSHLSTRKLQHFEFLGVLMGVCIRTGVPLVLNLPQIFWKTLVGQNPNIDDIFEIEMRLCKKFQTILNSTKEDFDDLQYYWTVPCCDGKDFDLTNEGVGGKDKVVTFEQRFEYVQKCIYHKFTELRVQCAAIKRGLAKIVPESILNLITHEEIESWVCGTNIIDVDLIRKNTKLEGYNPNDELIKNFWEFFEELGMIERRSFVKFCYAIERLPPTDEDWKRQGLILTIKKADSKKDGGQSSQDERLPEASTCFFHLKLPNYSNKEIMKKKIVCAFTIDNFTMNAEDNAADRQIRREALGGGDRNENRSYGGGSDESE